MVIKTIVTVAFLVVCTVGMHRMFWMLEQCVPITQEAVSKARARRWKGVVAAVVAVAWLGAAGLAFGLRMPQAMQAAIFAGPMAVTLPVLVWVLLVY